MPVARRKEVLRKKTKALQMELRLRPTSAVVVSPEVQPELVLLLAELLMNVATAQGADGESGANDEH